MTRADFREGGTGFQPVSLMHRLEACFTLVLLMVAVAWGEAPALPDTSGPEFKAIAALHVKAMQAASTTHREALLRLLRQRLEEAELSVKERKKTRNLTGIAVAVATKDIFDSAISNLVATGSFEMPSKVRRELDPTIAEFNTTRQRIDTDYANAKARIRKENEDRFTVAFYRIAPGIKGEGNASLIAERFDALVKNEESAKTAPAPDAGKTNAPAASGTNVQAVAAAPELPRIMGSSGEADQWVAVGRWNGGMAGLDVITIPILEMQKGTNTQNHFNPITGENSTWQYVAAQVLAPVTGMVFRLNRVTNSLGVEPVQWPSFRNSHSLIVRIQPALDASSRPAFDLQVALPGRDLSALFVGAPLEAGGAVKPLSPVTLALQTVPPGAAVWVDDAPLRDMRTPCRVRLPGGRHALRLVLPGYLPLSVTNQNYTKDVTLKLAFQPDPRVIRKSLTVSAGGDRWVSDGTRVNRGDTISIDVEGTWSCGSGKEPCDALGYPNNDAFFRYYMDDTSNARQFTGANYGALLMRIGETSRPIPAGKALKISAPESGSLFFDINEATGAKFRGDNASVLVLRLTIMPADAGTPAP